MNTMTLTLGSILHSAGIDPADAQAIRHAYVREHEDTGSQGIHADSTDEEILQYTRRQWVDPRRFPLNPPRFWVIFVREGGDRARLWSLVENRGEVENDGLRRSFDLVASDHLADLRNRLVIGWRSPRTWRLNGPTAAGYPVMEIADAGPVPFPGFDRLVLDYAQLQAVMRASLRLMADGALVGRRHLPDHRHPRRPPLHCPALMRCSVRDYRESQRNQRMPMKAPTMM
jgi:hypothetical protein